MLTLSRKIGESIVIGDDVEILITRLSPGRVRISIDAPLHVLIRRGELLERPEPLSAPPAPEPEAAAR